MESNHGTTIESFAETNEEIRAVYMGIAEFMDEFIGSKSVDFWWDKLSSIFAMYNLPIYQDNAGGKTSIFLSGSKINDLKEDLLLSSGKDVRSAIINLVNKLASVCNDDTFVRGTFDYMIGEELATAGS